VKLLDQRLENFYAFDKYASSYPEKWNQLNSPQNSLQSCLPSPVITRSLSFGKKETLWVKIIIFLNLYFFG